MLFFKNLTKNLSAVPFGGFIRRQFGGLICFCFDLSRIKAEAVIVCLGRKIQSKQSKLCETNPISGTPKMNLTHYSTNRYDNNSDLLTMQKRSQNEPKQTQFYPPPAEIICSINRRALFMRFEAVRCQEFRRVKSAVLFLFLRAD